MMIHKIEPHKYYPEFRDQYPKTSDYLLLFDGEKVYLPSADIVNPSTGTDPSDHRPLYLPTFEEVHKLLRIRQPMERFFLDCEYLFSIDDKAFYRKTTDDAGALMTFILPGCSVILSRNIWHSPGSPLHRSTVFVWTGNSAAAVDIPRFPVLRNGPASARNVARLNIPRSPRQLLSPL